MFRCGQEVRKPIPYVYYLVNVNPLISFYSTAPGQSALCVSTKWMKWQILNVNHPLLTDLSLCVARGVSSPQEEWRCSRPQTGPASPSPCFSHCRTAGYWCSVGGTQTENNQKSKANTKIKYAFDMKTRSAVTYWVSIWRVMISGPWKHSLLDTLPRSPGAALWGLAMS